MRRKIIAGNWKMNKTLREAMDLAKALRVKLINVNKVDIVLCPTAPNLMAVSEIIKDTNIELGAQNMHWEKSGAFTGEVSSAMLKSVGCSYVILGHSERRQFFGETDEGVNRKINSALSDGLTPIVCVGESLEQRQNGVTEEIVGQQVRGCLADLSEGEVTSLVLAYEPIWAIGTGINATPEQAEEVHSFIRKLLTELYNSSVAESIRIQYGGSVKPDNATILLSQSNIDGALVGGASLSADSFADIVKSAIM